MARKTRRIQEPSSDDDAPEAVSHSKSKADVKRNQKALHDFEVEENARIKARNRERDEKLKERARMTKGERTGKKSKGVKSVCQALERGNKRGGGDDEGRDADDVEARMLRSMKDAADEVEIDQGDEDDHDEFGRFRQDIMMDLGDDMESGSDASFVQDGDDDEMSTGSSGSIDSEALTDDEEMDDHGEHKTAPPQANTIRSSRKVGYLADDLFTAAFASQKSKLPPKKAEPTQQRTIQRRRRKLTRRAKDLIIGDRIIRTLPQPSDPQSQVTTQSLPSARARKFVEHSLALKGKRAILKAKQRGWERRPANIGVMKYQGAPHGFVRSKQ